MEEFRMFFLYVGYDIISEKFCSGNHQPYKKFVNNNKEVEWAQQLLQSVACVQAAKNHYKTLLPMLLNRNMVSLHRVCMDITSSNIVPHKEIHGFERCCITGVWHERCIDVSKGIRGGNTIKHLSIHNNEDTTPNPDSHQAPAPPPPTKQKSNTNNSAIFISPKFLHFSQMLWTMAKIDIIVKNYTLTWLQSNSSGAADMQELTSKFSTASEDFMDKLYKVFVHAVNHVCDSLVSHMYNPLFAAK